MQCGWRATFTDRGTPLTILVEHKGRCTKPLRGSFLAILSCSCISFDALSFLR